MTNPDEDRALTEPIGALFERNNARPLPTHSKPQHPHTILVGECMRALAKLPGWTRIRKRPVGRFILADMNGNPRKKPGGGWLKINVAVAGDADIEVLWTPPGANRPYPLMVECKTGKAELSDRQDTKREHVTRGGCWHFVARDAKVLMLDILAHPR